MSIKRRFQYKYHLLINVLKSLKWPEWIYNRFFYGGMIVITMVMGVFYIHRAGTMSTAGYVLHDLESKKSSLEIKVKKIEAEIASESAVSNVQKRLKHSNMLSIEKLNYLTIDNGVFAKR